LPAKYAPLANGVLSIFALAVTQSSSSGVWGINWGDLSIDALVLFVSSAGVYDLGQFSLKRFKQKDGALPVKNEPEEQHED